MDRRKNGQVNTWRVEQLNRVGSYLPVWGVCACVESVADWRSRLWVSCTYSWLLYSTHQGLIENGGGMIDVGGGGLQGGRDSFLRWSINTAELHRDKPEAPFHLLILSPAQPCGLLRSLRSCSLAHILSVWFTCSFTRASLSSFIIFASPQNSRIISFLPFPLLGESYSSFLAIVCFLSVAVIHHYHNIAL